MNVWESPGKLCLHLLEFILGVCCRKWLEGENPPPGRKKAFSSSLPLPVPFLCPFLAPSRRPQQGVQMFAGWQTIQTWEIKHPQQYIVLEGNLCESSHECCLWALYRHLFIFLILADWPMRHPEMAQPGHRSGLAKSPRIITVKAEAIGKFHEGVIKIIFPKIYKTSLRKRQENLTGKILWRRVLRYFCLWLGYLSTGAPRCCGSSPMPVIHLGTPCALVLWCWPSSRFWGGRALRSEGRAWTLLKGGRWESAHLSWGRHLAERENRISEFFVCFHWCFRF